MYPTAENVGNGMATNDSSLREFQECDALIARLQVELQNAQQRRLYLLAIRQQSLAEVWSDRPRYEP